MITKQFVSHLRSQSIRIRVYLDDWLILSADRQVCLRHTLDVIHQAESLGFSINLAKSELQPAQHFSYLSMTFDTLTMRVTPKEKRLQTLRAALVSMRSQNTTSARSLASLLGMMESLASLIPLARLHKRPLQRALAHRWSWVTHGWNAVVPLGSWFVDATNKWLDDAWLRAGVPITSSPCQRRVFTDASLIGWGAHLDDLSVSGQWPQSLASWHINRLELEAVALALKAFLRQIQGQSVRVFTDNATVCCYINKQGGTHSTLLSQSAEQLLLWCQSHSVTLSARHIPGWRNVIADALSRPRGLIPTEWTLSHRILEPVWAAWFRPQVDLFATRFNYRLPCYVSPVPDPGAWAIDALSLSWEGLVAYAFPPIPLVQKVLSKVRRERPCLILIAPRWAAQPWFPELLALTDCPPLPLQVRDGDLFQPRSGIPHGNPGFLQLHAWKLCATPYGV